MEFNDESDNLNNNLGYAENRLIAQSLSHLNKRNETIIEVSYEGGDSETPASHSMRHSQLSNSQILGLSRQSLSALA